MRTHITRRITTLATAALLTFGVVGCAATSSDVRHQGALASLSKPARSFRVVTHQVAQNRSAHHLIEKSIQQAMAGKGYVHHDDHGSDLVISYKVLTSIPGTDAPADSDAHNELSLLGVPDASGADDHLKVVLVTITDATTDRVVWVGWTFREVEPVMLPAATHEAVRDILDRIPTAPGEVAQNEQRHAPDS